MIAKGVIIYLLVINVIAFLTMGIDKYKARNNKNRVSEKTLFIFTLLLGSIGIWSGMYFFHHKTKKWQFYIGVPVLMIIHILLAVLLLKGSN